MDKICNRCNGVYEDVCGCPFCGCPEYRIEESADEQQDG